jgi:O-antigen/teichoic acid export membrane protein
MSREKGKGNYVRVTEILQDYVRLRYVCAVIPFLLLFFGADIVAHYYNEEVSGMIRIISFTFLTGPIKAAIQIAFRVELKFKETALSATIDDGLKLAIVSVLLLWYEVGPIAIIIAYVCSDILGSLVALFLWGGTLKSLFPRSLGLRRESGETFYSILLTHGKWGILTNYVGGLGNSVRIWAVKFFVGTEAVALYSVAQGIYQQAMSLFPLNLIIAPILYENFDNHERLSHIAAKGIKYQILGYCGVALVVAISLPVLVSTLFPHYEPSLPLFYTMLPALIPMAYSGIISPLFVAKQMQREMFMISLARSVLIAAISPLFVYAFGITGVAIEIFITALVFAYERYRRARKIIPEFSLNGMLTFDDYDRQLIAVGKKHFRRLIGIVTKKSTS